ncbi:lactonase family protein [Mesobacillus maritimus]|uniref:lactonase family protein n=1 Tax=Mesobacillus maritimus TaxID=1643336 RepID=UPI00384FBBFC
MKNNHLFRGFIGTYTKGESKGIYSFQLDTQGKTISNIEVVAELENPTYLTITEDQQFLYSVVKEGESGGVAAFSLSEDAAQLRELNRTLESGASPCHVITGPNQSVLATNYHKGTVTYYKSNEDGSITAPLSFAKHEGSGPDPRQEKAHTHYSGYTPDGKYIVVAELGIDQIITYRLENGQLVEVTRLATKPGSGPRHLTFHPREPYAYVMTEFSSELIVLKYNQNDGSFEQKQVISALPDSFNENNQGSAIHITSDGKFVYVANRGHDSIAVFEVNQETYQLSLIEHVSTEGNWPRDFMLDPSENFLIVANQNSSNLVLYSREQTNGKLSLLQKDVTVPDPVCVKFLNHSVK